MYLDDLYTIPINLSGLPGMSIPCGFGDKGRPVGLQIVGNHFDEARMLGANGVPFFVIDRTYGVSGAQSAETFLHALRTAYAAEDAAAR